jgi:phosphonoacetaldehyde hydrolase
MSRFSAIILDWAGTTVDFGSRAPTQVFLEIFSKSGVPITEAEARGPMGKAKREHIANVLEMPRVRNAWLKAKGTLPTDADVSHLYESFLPLQKSVLANFSDVIPGVAKAIAWCRDQGMKIGSTTGYTRELMAVVAPIAASQGYCPEAIVCSDEVAAGRPAPWLNFRAAEALGVYPMDRVIIVDDTPLGIHAGRNAGCITVGVTQTGNEMGLSQAELDMLEPSEKEKRTNLVGQKFLQAGAHFLVQSVANLPALLQSIG